MTPGPSTARSLLTSVATFCSAAAGGPSAQSTSTIRSTGTSPGRDTASSFSSVRDLRLPTSPSASSVPSRTTPNVPARRSSTWAVPADPAGRSLPTPTSTFVPLISGRTQATTLSFRARLRASSGSPTRELDPGPPGQRDGHAQGQQRVEDVGRDSAAEPPVGPGDRQRDNGPEPGPGRSRHLGPAAAREQRRDE